MIAHGYTIYDMLERASVMFGGRRAVVFEGTTLSYKELLARADALAAGLQDLGIAPGERLCVLSQNNLEYFELYLASAKLGAIMYPVNWRLTAQEVGHVVTRAGPVAFVYDESCAEVAKACRAVERPGLKHWLAIGGDDDALDVATLYEHDGASTRHGAAQDDISLVISTAAVDVIPRGAALTHGNIAASGMQTMGLLGLNETDAALLPLPLFHITAVGHAFAMIQCGGCILLFRRFDAVAVVSAADELGGTLLGTFPPMLGSVLDAAKESGSQLPHLRHVMGLEGPDMIARLHEDTNAQFWTGFGQSETSGFVTLQRAGERAGTSGRIGPMASVKLFDDDDNEVAVGEVGEIVVRGPLVMGEYFGQEDVTAHTFRSGWHHTGDRGKFDADGYLTYAGRKPEKELIKPGGENVYPAEVEKIIDEMEAVRGCCVFGVPDEKWGEAVKAVVETDEGTLSADDVIEYVGSRIGRFKRPRIVAFSTALPRGGDGKVDREKVKAQNQ
ncbi:MAG: AMP-binding protein [Gammaproteobacteria bacterium]|nr:AMP-binding protein [Gammaproteobacteria bacterium]